MFKHLQFFLLLASCLVASCLVVSCLAEKPTPDDQHQQAIKLFLHQAASKPPTSGPGVMVLLRTARRLSAEAPLNLAEQILTARLGQPLTHASLGDNWWLLAALEADQYRATSRFQQTAELWGQTPAPSDQPLAFGVYAKIFQVFRDRSALSNAQVAADIWLTKTNAPVAEKVHGLLSLIYLYQADFDPRWYDAAVQLANTMPYSDLAPSSRGILALCQLYLANLSLDDTHLEAAQQIIASTPEPHKHPEVLLALDFLTDTSKEIAVIGPPGGTENVAMVEALQKQFLPNVVIASGKYPDQRIPLLSGKPLWQSRPGGAFVCERGACRFPTGDSTKALALANQFQPLE